MTKVIKIGNVEKVVEKKPIHFEYLLDCINTGDIGERVARTYTAKANRYNYVELICRDYIDGYDLMFAYNNPDKRGEGILYIGYFNDGVVD